MPKELKLKVGGVYRTRDGDKVTIKNAYNKYPGPLTSYEFGSKNGQLYTKGGFYWSDKNPCGLDLVEVWVDKRHKKKSKRRTKKKPVKKARAAKSKSSPVKKPQSYITIWKKKNTTYPYGGWIETKVKKEKEDEEGLQKYKHITTPF